MVVATRKASVRKERGAVQRTTIDLPQDIWIKLKIQAARQRKSMKGVILDAVEIHLQRGPCTGERA